MTESSQDPSVENQKSSRKLHFMSGREPKEMAFGDNRLETSQPGLRSHDLYQRAVVKIECSIQNSFGVTEPRHIIEFIFREPGTRGFSRGHVDQRNLASGPFNFPTMGSQVSQCLTAEGTARMP